MDWKDHLDPIIKEYLNEILKKTLEYRDAYLKAQDPRIAQLWVAIAFLSLEIQKIKEELKEIKRKLKDIKIEEDLKKY